VPGRAQLSVVTRGDTDRAGPDAGPEGTWSEADAVRTRLAEALVQVGGG
jgi:hypothetical protein